MLSEIAVTEVPLSERSRPVETPDLTNSGVSAHLQAGCPSIVSCFLNCYLYLEIKEIWDRCHNLSIFNPNTCAKMQTLTINVHEIFRNWINSSQWNRKNRGLSNEQGCYLIELMLSFVPCQTSSLGLPPQKKVNWSNTIMERKNSKWLISKSEETF